MEATASVPLFMPGEGPRSVLVKLGTSSWLIQCTANREVPFLLLSFIGALPSLSYRSSSRFLSYCSASVEAENNSGIVVIALGHQWTQQLAAEP